MSDAITRTLVLLEEELSLETIDTIEDDGQLWLVGGWAAPDAEGWRQAKSLVRLTGLDYSPAESDPSIHWVLPTPIPRRVLSGRASKEHPERYVLRVAPDVRRRAIYCSDRRE